MESPMERRWTADGRTCGKWMEQPMENGWKRRRTVDGKLYGNRWNAGGKAVGKPYGKPTEKHMDSRWRCHLSRWKADGRARGKSMEKQMESRWKILWKVDGKPTGKHMDKADEQAGGQSKSDGESYLPSGCMGTQLVLRVRYWLWPRHSFIAN